MSDKEMLGSFLGIPSYDSFEKENRKSVLLVALRRARDLTGRDIETGIPVSELPVDPAIKVIEEKRYYSNLLLGLTGYLIILDMMGCAFSKIKGSKKHPEEFVYNLINFTFNNDNLKVNLTVGRFKAQFTII